MKSAVIAGASSLIGKQKLYNLLENESYKKVVVLFRNELTIQNRKIKLLILDIYNLTLYKVQLKQTTPSFT